MFHWISFFTYAVATAVTPGPNNLMSMSLGARLGFRRALPFNLGILAGFTAVMLLCTAACSLLTAWLPRLRPFMLLVGAAYMLYLAWEMLRDSGEATGIVSAGGFWRGAVLQFVNPKIYIYCIMSMEAYILPYFQGQPFALAAFAVLLAAIGFLFTLCWSAFGSVFHRLFTEHWRIVNRIMALLLVYCAVSLFL